MALTPSTKNQALLDAQHDLWHHALCYIKPVALKSAIDLGIADAIHDHGGTATLRQIAAKARIHESKLPYLRRLMRVLTVTGVFSVELSRASGSDDHVYGLTSGSRLLVSSNTTNLSPTLNLYLSRVLVSPFLNLSEWFLHEVPRPTVFETAHGQNLWDFIGHDTKFANIFDNAMVADNNLVMDMVVMEYGDLFHGISSLIDVGGGLGSASQAISKAFPHVKCSVLDLPHVVARAPTGTDVEYIAGDMFESIPPANAAFIKWVLHDWEDDECVKVLRNCKKAIPPRDAGGKVIIFDMVVGADKKHNETQVLFDLYIMSVGGAQRDEQEWRKIISEAGFSDFKIIRAVGVRSIIEVYP